MSYSVTAVVQRDSFRADLDRALGDTGYLKDPEKHVGDHLVVALGVVERMISVMGPAEAPLRVTISGHANEGHVSVEGWAEESMTIAVSVLKPEPVAAEGETDAALDDA